MITLNERSNIWLQELYPLLAGIGIGMLFHTPFQVVTNLLPKRDLASATGAFFLVRFIGTTTGLVRTCPSEQLIVPDIVIPVGGRRSLQ
jgi:hypothetical protein